MTLRSALAEQHARMLAAAGREIAVRAVAEAGPDDADPGRVVAELDRAAELLLRAVARMPGASPNHGAVLADLANVWRHRYTAGRDVADLDRAIGVYREVSALTNSPANAVLADRMRADAHYERYFRLEEPEDLDSVLACASRVLHAQDVAQPVDRFLACALLADAHVDRYALDDDPALLDTAVHWYGQALAAAGSLKPGAFAGEVPRLRLNLAEAHRLRHAVHGSRADLDAEIAILSGLA